MSTELAAAIMEIAQRKASEFFSEAASYISEAEEGETVRADPATPATTWNHAVNDPSVLDREAPEGSWEQVGPARPDTYKWPDGNLDEYNRFVRYRGTGGFAGLQLALGVIANGDVVGFVLGTGGGSKRGITYFFPTDDAARTNKKISMIRGGGESGRSGFGSNDPTPRAYAGFDVEMLRDRKAGKWNVQAVVVDGDDCESMLRHTALQAILRGLFKA
jgi:hypothetical protein